MRRSVGAQRFKPDEPTAMALVMVQGGEGLYPHHCWWSPPDVKCKRAIPRATYHDRQLPLRGGRSRGSLMGVLERAAQRSVRGCWRLGWRCPEIFLPRGEWVGEPWPQAGANCVGGKYRSRDLADESPRSTTTNPEDLLFLQTISHSD